MCCYHVQLSQAAWITSAACMWPLPAGHPAGLIPCAASAAPSWPAVWAARRLCCCCGGGLCCRGPYGYLTSNEHSLAETLPSLANFMQRACSASNALTIMCTTDAWHRELPNAVVFACESHQPACPCSMQLVGKSVTLSVVMTVVEVVAIAYL